MEHVHVLRLTISRNKVENIHKKNITKTHKTIKNIYNAFSQNICTIAG